MRRMQVIDHKLAAAHIPLIKSNAQGKREKILEQKYSQSRRIQKKAPKNENATSIIKTNQYKLSQYIKNYHKNKPGSFNPRAMNENA